MKNLFVERVNSLDDDDLWEVRDSKITYGHVVYNDYDKVWHHSGDGYVKEFPFKEDAVKALVGENG